MPANPRVRNNGVFGTTTDNPLTAVAVTFNSAGLANLEVIASEHAVVTLDPLRQFGNPEIVIITVHTAAATVATITRAAYGTVARSHPLGTLWVHAAVDEDFTEIVTSSTRPTDPYRGQMIFETDTDRYVGRSIADVWQTIVDLGAWDTYTPVNTNITVGNGTQVAKFTRMGRTIHGYYRLVWGTTTSFGGDIAIGFPVTATGDDFVGGALAIDATGGTSTNQRIQLASRASTGSAEIIHGTSNTSGNAGIVNATNPITWATNDTLAFSFTYEAAT